MAKCVEKIKHSCGSYALQVFQQDDGKYDGFCFACGKYEPDPYKDRPEGYKPQVVFKPPEQIKQEIEEISQYQTVDLPDRKLKKEYLEYFGVKIGLNETDGVTPNSHYYPYHHNGELVGYKCRVIESKKMWAVGTIKGAEMFGWKQALATGGKKIFITEGELDAVALFQIIKEQNKNTAYADLNPAVVSVSNGAGGAAKQIAQYLPAIRRTFKEIVIVFDNDEPGRAAVEKILLIAPDAMVAELPAKDANDCLIEGRSKACYNACMFQAQKPKNTRLVNGKDLHEQAKEPPKFGIPWPWKHITNATRGIRTGETIYIGAGQKQG